MRKPLVVHHNPCIDGVAAAWCFYHKFGDKVDFAPGKYQSDLPDVFDRDVYLVDFSFKRDQMIEALSLANKIVLIDHHKSALEDLWDLSQYPTFDMSPSSLQHSGARLAWDYCFGTKKKRPVIIDHIEDRDLWKFNLEHTREITTAIFSYDQTIDQMDKFMKLTIRGIDKLIAEGITLLRQHKKSVELTIRTAMRYIDLPVGMKTFYGVPVINCPPNLTSDVGNEVALNEPFAMMYQDTANYREFSLRSSEQYLGAADVSVIASKFGGGGHKHAAGFKVDRNHFLAQI